MFLKLYGVTLTDDELALIGSELNPPGSDVTYREGQDRCPGQSDTGTASLRVVTWDAWYRPEERRADLTSLGEERVIFDQQSFAVVVAADSVADADIPLPPSASDLATVNEHPDGGVTSAAGQ